MYTEIPSYVGWGPSSSWRIRKSVRLTSKVNVACVFTSKQDHCPWETIWRSHQRSPTTSSRTIDVKKTTTFNRLTTPMAIQVAMAIQSVFTEKKDVRTTDQQVIQIKNILLKPSQGNTFVPCWQTSSRRNVVFVYWHLFLGHLSDPANLLRDTLMGFTSKSRFLEPAFGSSSHQLLTNYQRRPQCHLWRNRRSSLIQTTFFLLHWMMVASISHYI